jgi:glycosyltransferase involved in cell wall biosynthesis/SAM-dependent methyltransferase
MNTGKKGGKKGNKNGGTLTTGKRDLAGTAPVSVLVPTLNEARNLADCLAALAWAGEVVVFDSHSTDGTQQIASNWGARVVERTFSDFASHKNWALETIDFAHDWILIIDADERVTPGLEGEIRTVVARTGDRPGDRPGGPDGYYLARKNIFAGRWIRHAAMYPDHNLRLFRRGRARYEPRIVHEHMICDGETGVLSEPLVHHDYKGIERYIDRHNTYSSLEAVATHLWLDGAREAKDGLKADLFGNGPARRRAIKRFAYRYLPARPTFVFLWMYLFRLGFLDGRIGLRYCLLRFFYELQVDLKLEELRDPASPISEAYGHFLQQDQGEPGPECLACGGATDILRHDLHDTRFGIPGAWSAARCRDCRLLQTAPRPEPAELAELYARHYNYTSSHSGSHEGSGNESAYRRMRDAFFASPISRLWLALDGDISFHARRGSGRLLEIGCNEGRNLDFYRRSGFSVEGQEPNPVAAAAARARGHEVKEVELDALSAAEPYDVVVLSQVLEHTPEPAQMLAHIYRCLRPGGEVWISCPNERSWLADVFSGYWINWHVPFHLSHFDAHGLARVVKNAGFDIIAADQATPALWMAQSLIARITSRPGRPTPLLRNPVLVPALMLAIRIGMFPILWWFNRIERGDCLRLIAKRP